MFMTRQSCSAVKCRYQFILIKPSYISWNVSMYLIYIICFHKNKVKQDQRYILTSILCSRFKQTGQAPNKLLWLKLNYYTLKMWGHRLQWISHKMNIWHPEQLKKFKSQGPFWSYQLNSTANPAYLPHNWTKLAKSAGFWFFQLSWMPNIHFMWNPLLPMPPKKLT